MLMITKGHPMSHLRTGVSNPMPLLRDVKQFLFFIEYRLQHCESADDALRILHDVDAALSRLDQAMAQIVPDGRGAASMRPTRPMPRARRTKRVAP